MPNKETIIDRKYPSNQRIELTDDIRHQFRNLIRKWTVPQLAKRTGLPYALVYNIAHGRLKSISVREYRSLFQQALPPIRPKKVDGAFFRQMVRLWLFLHDQATIADLWRKLFGTKASPKPDYRLFSGQVQSVTPQLELKMARLLEADGLDPATIGLWTRELGSAPHSNRIPYAEIRPILVYLHKKLDINPTTLLRQLFERYESGELKSVSRPIFDRALYLKKRAEMALAQADRFALEQLREEVYGAKTGFVLYSAIHHELKFLRRYARRSMRGYLGRSASTYERGKAKRIADWRARRIIADCDRFIAQKPDLSLAELPVRYQCRGIVPILSVLVARSAQLLQQREGIAFEKHVLLPINNEEKYQQAGHGFTSFERASIVLGMKKRAFDLMVAHNCDVFKRIGTYDRQWYLSDLYLRELAANQHFDIITAKYELMAKNADRTSTAAVCLH